MEVKFCENNFNFGTEDVMKKIKEKYEKVDVSVESCLGFCIDCGKNPYALVDGEIVQGFSAQELYEKISSRVKWYQSYTYKKMICCIHS